MVQGTQTSESFREVLMRGVAPNIEDDSFIDDLSSFGSKGLNHQDCEVLFHAGMKRTMKRITQQPDRTSKSSKTINHKGQGSQHDKRERKKGEKGRRKEKEREREDKVKRGRKVEKKERREEWGERGKEEGRDAEEEKVQAGSEGRERVGQW